MILVKKIAVLLNLVHLDFKQYISDFFKKEGLNITPEQFLLMDVLWNGESSSQQTIANAIKKDKNSVTKLVDALEKKDLVKRVPVANDRRQNLVSLTTLGEQMKDRAKSTAISAISAIVDDIPAEEIEVMIKVLARMANNMKEYNININNISRDGHSL